MLISKENTGVLGGKSLNDINCVRFSIMILIQVTNNMENILVKIIDNRISKKKGN